MDKYEYQFCMEQIQQLISEKRFKEAMEIADTIDWRRVRSVSKLVTISEIYKVNKRYEDAKDILLLAYDKHPTGRDIIFALCELFIKLGDTVQAVESYKEFMAVAPGDPNAYILLYKIYKSQEASLEEQIDVLEELKSREYMEKWAYELAYLYHKTGQEAKCVAECDELILWFGEGKYVRKAMELKMQHQALSKDQQAKFDGRAMTSSLPVFKQPGADQQGHFGNNAQQTGPMLDQYGEYIQQTGQITGSITGNLPQTPPEQPYQGQQQVEQPYGMPVQPSGYEDPAMVTPDMYADPSQPIQVTPGINHLGMTQDIMAQALGTGVWSSTDIQDQLGSQVREAMGQDPYATGGYPQDGYATGGYATGGYAVDAYGNPIDPSMQQTGGMATGNMSGYDGTGDMVSYQGTGDMGYEQPSPQRVAPVQKAPEISVNTGIIDIPESALPKETDDIMSQLEGVIPGTEEPKNDEITSDEESEDISLTGSTTVNGPKTKSRITGQIPSFLPAEDEKKESQSEEEPEEDSSLYEIKDETETKEQEISRISAIQEKAFPGYVAPKIPADNQEESASEAKEETPETVESEEPALEAESSSDSEESALEEAVAVKDSPEEKEEKLTPVGDESGSYPYDTVTDIGYVEELPEIEQPEDVDEMLKTGKIPAEEISKAIAYETDSVPEADELEIDEVDDDDDDESQTPSYMRENARARREFDDDEYKIFCRYDGMEALKAQLVDTLDTMSMDASHGNVAIMGPETVDCKGIAISIVKAMQSKKPSFSGKVAKISGEALNKKNIKATLEKLENGALIVERAGGLTKESVVIIAGALAESDKPILVIFEGRREEIRPLFRHTKLMKTVFDARMDIAEFTDEDLVNYARGYALEREYSIDDMGGLALHNQISEMQTYDHKVTIEEVKELVDMAIKRVDKKNVGHLMDMLLGRRYDDEDNIILTEKDFIF